MISYKENISAEIDRSKPDIIEQLKSIAKNVQVSGDNVEIRRHNSWVHMMAPTGKINIHLTAISEAKTTLEGIVRPSIFTLKAALGFTILSVLVWSLIFWFFPLNVYMLVGFVLHWIVMCFVALYMLVGFMAVLTVMLVIFNFSDFPILYVLIAWIVTLLITHLTLRYNKATLREYLSAIISKLKLSDKL